MPPIATRARTSTQLLPPAPLQSTALGLLIKARLLLAQAAIQLVSPATDQPATSAFLVPILPIFSSQAHALPTVRQELSEMELFV